MSTRGARTLDRSKRAARKTRRLRPDRSNRKFSKRVASAALFVDSEFRPLSVRATPLGCRSRFGIRERLMLVRVMMGAVLLAATASSAFAQAPVERGKYLVNTIMTCQNCHTPKGERGAPIFERDLSSGLSWDEPPFKVTASNITQDKETGIGSWTDEQIKTALRKGQRPNGVHLAAIMPYDFYEILTDNDLNAIVAYLRTVKPVRQTVPDPIYKIALPRHIVQGAETPFTEADMGDKVKKGFDLATIGHCF